MMLPPIALLLVTSLLLACGPAFALTQADVVAGAERMYRERLAELARAGMLDRDAAFLARIERIGKRLGEQARQDDAAGPAWSWEFHASSDPDDDASCMAGGKILVSQPYVERMQLSDAQLAMVLSHEMQHAILLHNLKEYEAARQLEPKWLAQPFSALEHAVDHDPWLMRKLAALNKEQEVEADRAGLAMAWRAGWRASELAGYFRKLEESSSMSGVASPTHPSALQRWRRAREQAAKLDAAKKRTAD
jgi:predicted Zn-dependent protease